jgi:maltose alpha-D-glucosyltransferase / alpha-amylase
MSGPSWYKNAVFYQVYIRAFFDSDGDGHGDLPGLTQKLDYLQELGVNCLWLMPLYPSPLKDDGYDIADFYAIHPDYGTLEDLKLLLKTAHARDMRVITDLVLNHTSDAHPWFQAARADRASPYRDYYVWSDDDRKYGEARIIFIDTEFSNWTWDPLAGQYYWHRFYASQPDLNYDNPAVRAEMLNVMKFWLDLGVDGFRADAVPYLFEREGTNCENLPETHAFLKEMRRFVDNNYSGRVLLCEANQWPHDVRTYFGDADEFQMAFHFPLMPRVFMSIRRGDSGAIQWALEKTPSIPGSCQWGVFLRNHDELTLEMISEEDRQWMWREYAPDSRMRVNLGIRRRLAPLLNDDPRKIELAHSLLFSLPGSPFIYYGDEIGMGDNVELADRNGVRTPMQWSAENNAGFSKASPEDLYAPVVAGEPFGPAHVNAEIQRNDPRSLWSTIRAMIATRSRFKAFGSGDLQWLDCRNGRVAAYTRSFENETILVLQNLSPSNQTVDLKDSFPGAGRVEIIFGETTRQPGTIFDLMPYQYIWLKSNN